MKQPRLDGKTVMIATSDRFYAGPLKDKLEDLGGTVLFSNDPPHGRDNVASIAAEVGVGEKPNVDALIIHHSNVRLEESRDTAIALTNQFKSAIPVIVSDVGARMTDMTEIRNAGATYLDGQNVSPTETAAKVADLVADRSKAGRTRAGLKVESGIHSGTKPNPQ